VARSLVAKTQAVLVVARRLAAAAAAGRRAAVGPIEPEFVAAVVAGLPRK